MKNLIISITILGLMATNILFAQIPQAFKYQAVIRDTTGQVFQNKLISLRISILKGDVEGEEVYSEIHDVQTDQFGLVNLNIGQGHDVNRDFSTIPWGEDTFFLKVEIDMDGAMDYHLLGVSQLMAVPYALYAESAGNDYWDKGANGIHYAEGNVGIGTDNPQNTLDVLGGANIRGNVTLGSGNWIGLYLNGFGNDDQPEWLIASHNQGGLQLRRWDGVDFSEHYLKVDEGRFRFGAYNSPPLMYQFHGWAYITDSLKVGGNNFFVANDGKVGIGTTTPQARLHINSEDDSPLLFLAGFNPGIKFTDLNNDHKTWQIKSDNHNQMHNFRILEDGDENKTRFYIAEGGNVGIGTTDPGTYKFRVEIDEDGGSERAIMLLKNKSTAVGSLCNLYISSGESGSTYLNYVAPSYIHQGGKYKSHTIL